MSKKKRRDLTSAEKAASERLKAEFKEKKKEHKLTYEKLAALCGWSTSNITQYFNGHIPLNMESLVKICAQIKIDPQSIFPEMFEGVSYVINIDDNELLSKFNRLDPSMQDAIRKMIDAADPEGLSQ